MAKYTKEENREWQNSLARKPVGVSVILRDTSGKVIVVKPNYRDTWNLPGGVVDESESPLEAGMREVKEELGIELNPSELKLAGVNYTAAGDGFVDFISVIFDGGVLDNEQIQGIKLQHSELDEYRLVPAGDIKQFLNDLKGRTVEAVADGRTEFLTAEAPET